MQTIHKLILWLLVVGASLILLHIFLSLPARAGNECHTVDDVKAILSKQVAGLQYSTVSKAQIPDIVRIFNSMPPASNYDADQVYVVSGLPTASNKLVILFKADCFVVFQELGPQMFDALMGSPT